MTLIRRVSRRRHFAAADGTTKQGRNQKERGDTASGDTRQLSIPSVQWKRGVVLDYGHPVPHGYDASSPDFGVELASLQHFDQQLTGPKATPFQWNGDITIDSSLSGVATDKALFGRTLEENHRFSWVHASDKTLGLAARYPSHIDESAFSDFDDTGSAPTMEPTESCSRNQFLLRSEPCDDAPSSTMPKKDSLDRGSGFSEEYPLSSLDPSLETEEVSSETSEDELIAVTGPEEALSPFVEAVARRLLDEHRRATARQQDATRVLSPGTHEDAT